MTSVEGAIFCNHYSKDGDDADLKKFIEAYKAEYNEEPNQFAALGYDAMNIMIAAIEKAGSTDSAAIIEALKNTDFKGVTSSENIKFDENRNPVKSAALTQIKDGEYKFLGSITVTKNHTKYARGRHKVAAPFNKKATVV